MTAIEHPSSEASEEDTEEILVLYGSQTGNSEAAAEEISSLLPAKLSSARLNSTNSTNSTNQNNP